MHFDEIFVPKIKYVHFSFFQYRKFQVEEERRTLLLKAEEVRNSEVSLNEAENKKDEKSKLKKNNNNSSLSTMLLQGINLYTNSHNSTII